MTLSSVTPFITQAINSHQRCTAAASVYTMSLHTSIRRPHRESNAAVEGTRETQRAPVLSPLRAELAALLFIIAGASQCVSPGTFWRDPFIYTHSRAVTSITDESWLRSTDAGLSDGPRVVDPSEKRHKKTPTYFTPCKYNLFSLKQIHCCFASQIV